MEKSIIITEKGMEIKGFNIFESIGILRFHEKYLWLKISSAISQQEKNTNEVKTKK